MAVQLDDSRSDTSKDQAVALLLVSPDFFPTRGGAELRFRRYLPGLINRGIRIKILSGTPVRRKLNDTDIQSEWYQKEIGSLVFDGTVQEIPTRQVRLPDSGPSERSTILNRELLRFCRELTNRPDVVQFLSSLPTSAGSCLKALRRIGIPSIFAYTLPGKQPLNPLKRMLRKISFRGLCNNLDCIITASTATKDLLLQMGVKSKIEVIPNGVDLTRFRPARNTSERLGIRQHLGIDVHSQVILSIGAIHPRKGTDLLLEAWVSLASRFPNLHLYLAGMRHDLNAPELAHFRERLGSLVCKSNASDRVHFIGYTEDVENYLKASDLLVFPSHREGMPNAVLEAMASGLPCVLTPFIGLSSDFGKPGQEYLLACHDSKAIGDAVASVLGNRDLQNRLGDSGRKWVEHTMDIEDALDRYAEVYRDIAASKARI